MAKTTNLDRIIDGVFDFTTPKAIKATAAVLQTYLRRTASRIRKGSATLTEVISAAALVDSIGYRSRRAERRAAK